MRRRSFIGGGMAAIAAPGLLPWTGASSPRRDTALAVEASIRLSSNENPLGMPESARRAILDSIAGGSIYPQRTGELVDAIAKKHRVSTDNVVPGAGSTDVLRMAVQAVAAPGARVILPDPTFEHVEFYARPFIDDIVKVPLARDHAMDLDAMRDAADAARGPVIAFICNPNNPTGTITSCDDVEAWIRSSPERVTFIVDEAYFDFVDDPGYRTLIPLIGRPNVVVSRTFSKVYGLAGLRAGYGLASPAMAARMKAVTLKNTLNHFAEVAALACIGDAAFMRRSVAVNREGRDIARAVLRELELEALPSHTNFVMHRIRGTVADYIARMADRGIMVGRAFPPMLDHNRVSIGTPEQMQTWAETLRSFRRQGWV